MALAIAAGPMENREKLSNQQLSAKTTSLLKEQKPYLVAWL
jgi:hypothetical protein